MAWDITTLSSPHQERETHNNPTPRSEWQIVEDGKLLVGGILWDANIETMSSQSVEVEIFPQRWWLIKSIKIWGVEILYQDMYGETLLHEEKNVKGWIPYMFPNAGPLTDKQKSISWLNLPQHGIARISPWKEITINKSEKSIQQEFFFDETSWYPHKWTITNIIKDRPNGVEIIHDIYSRSKKDMPISSWLHPYFRVPEGDKSKIKWDFSWGEKIQEQVDIWSNDWTISFENPNPWEPFSVIIPGLGRLELAASKDYKIFWVWSLPEKDFVCIEPVMWYEWAIVNNPVIIKSWKSNRNYMKIDLFQD